MLVSLLMMMVMGLSVPVNAEEITNPAPAFKDLSSAHWAYDSIMYGVEKGYITGFPDDTFRPNDPVTVAQFLTMMLMSMTEKDSDGFVWWSEENLSLVPEWKVSSLITSTSNFELGTPWYQNFVVTSKNIGVIKGEYDGRYNEKLTRERASRLVENLDLWFNGPIHNAYSLIAAPELFKDYNHIEEYLRGDVAKVALRGIMVGNTQGNFNPKALISRAEAARLVMVLAQPGLRNKPVLDLVGVPYSVVPNPGYKNEMTFVFANPEMKNIYDKMAENQNYYSGATDAYNGSLEYYENDELKRKNFDRVHYFDFSDPVMPFDLSMGFEGNTYTLSLSTLAGRLERASIVIDQLTSLVFKKNSSVVSKLFADSVASERSGKVVEINKVIEGRQIVISSTGYDFLRIAISAYQDSE